MTTSPGHIPEDNEWDMPEISEQASNVDKEEADPVDPGKSKNA
jgi:hypothetical protein